MVDTPSEPIPAAASPTPPAASRPVAPRPTHPLIWAAVLVWLSVDAIGDGLLALGALLASITASRDVTPS